MRSIVEDARDEIKADAPKIRPPTPETLDSLRALAGPLARPQDPLVAGYADQRAQQRSSGVQTLNRDPLNLGGLRAPEPSGLTYTSPSGAVRPIEARRGNVMSTLPDPPVRAPRLAGPSFAEAGGVTSNRQAIEDNRRLLEADPGSPHGTTLFEPAIRGGRAAGRYVGESLGETWAGTAAGAVVKPALRAVGIEPPSAGDVGGAVGAFAGAQVATPEDAVLTFLTGGFAGETTGVGRALQSAFQKAATKAGMRVEQFAATEAGQRFITNAASERGALDLGALQRGDDLGVTGSGGREAVSPPAAPRSAPPTTRSWWRGSSTGGKGTLREFRIASEAVTLVDEDAVTPELAQTVIRSVREAGVDSADLADILSRPQAYQVGDMIDLMNSAIDDAGFFAQRGQLVTDALRKAGVDVVDFPESKLAGAAPDAKGRNLAILNPDIAEGAGGYKIDPARFGKGQGSDLRGRASYVADSEERAGVYSSHTFDPQGTVTGKLATAPEVIRFEPAAAAPRMGEAAQISPQIAARIGASAAGGAAGSTQGDTPQERFRNALIGAGMGAAGAELIIRNPDAISAFIKSERGALGKGDVPGDELARAADEVVDTGPATGAGTPARAAQSPPAPVESAAFNPTPEQMTHFRTLIDHGDWTTTPGARIAANTALKKLVAGEVPSDKQFALFHRALGSQQPTAPKPKSGAPKKPRGKAQRAAVAEPPLAEGAEPRGLTGERVELPSDAGATQLALADNALDAYVGAIAGEGVPPEQTFTRFTSAMAALSKITRGTGAVAVDVLTLPKTLKAGIDVGWAGRNGWRLMPRNPAEWGRMWKLQFKALASPEKAAEIDAATQAFPNFTRSQQAKRPLAYLEPGTGDPAVSGEEFTSRITKHVPLLNRFERAYVHPGNWMRQAVLDKWVTRLVEVNKRPVNDEEFQLLVDHLNNATLRGNTDKLGNTAQTLSSMLFSLRGQVSGPQFAADAIRAVVNGTGQLSPEARKIVAENFGAYVSMGMTALGLVAATGYMLDKNGKPTYARVDLNNLSPTFGQINVGGLRWNYWGADQSLVRTAIQLARGKVQKPGLPPLKLDRRQALERFGGNKIAPGAPKAIWDELVNKGRSYSSGPFNESGMDMNTPAGALIYAFNQISPIPLETAVGAWKETGGGVKGAITAPTATGADVLGLTTSTYELKASDRETSQAAKQQVAPIIERSGYNDIGGRVFARMQEQGTVPPEYDSYEQYRDAMLAEVEKRLEARDMDPQLASVIVDRLPAVKAYTDVVSTTRKKLRENNPELNKALLEAGEREPTIADLAPATP